MLPKLQIHNTTPFFIINVNLVHMLLQFLNIVRMIVRYSGTFYNSICRRGDATFTSRLRIFVALPEDGILEYAIHAKHVLAEDQTAISAFVDYISDDA